MQMDTPMDGGVMMNMDGQAGQQFGVMPFQQTEMKQAPNGAYMTKSQMRKLKKMQQNQMGDIATAPVVPGAMDGFPQDQLAMDMQMQMQMAGVQPTLSKKQLQRQRKLERQMMQQQQQQQQMMMQNQQFMPDQMQFMQQPQELPFDQQQLMMGPQQGMDMGMAMTTPRQKRKNKQVTFMDSTGMVMQNSNASMPFIDPTLSNQQVALGQVPMSKNARKKAAQAQRQMQMQMQMQMPLMGDVGFQEQQLNGGMVDPMNPAFQNWHGTAAAGAQLIPQANARKPKRRGQKNNQMVMGQMVSQQPGMNGQFMPQPAGPVVGQFGQMPQGFADNSFGMTGMQGISQTQRGSSRPRGRARKNSGGSMMQ